MNKTLNDIIREEIEPQLADTYVCRPARVESYNAEANTCSATIPVPKLIITPSERRSQGFQPLENVPVAQVRAGNVSFTVVPQPGDLVLLLFADRALDLLLDTGQAGDPGDERHHDLMDAIALPIFFTSKSVPRDSGTASIGWESSATVQGLRIHFGKDVISLGEPAGAYHVAAGEKVKEELQALRSTVSNLLSAYGAHGHPVSVAGPSGAPSTCSGLR